MPRKRKRKAPKAPSPINIVDLVQLAPKLFLAARQAVDATRSAKAEGKITADEAVLIADDLWQRIRGDVIAIIEGK